MANGSLCIRHLGEAGNVDVRDVEIRDVQVRDVGFRDMWVRVTGAGEGDEVGQRGRRDNIDGADKELVKLQISPIVIVVDAITVGVRQGCSSRQSHAGIRNFQR